MWCVDTHVKRIFGRVIFCINGKKFSSVLWCKLHFAHKMVFITVNFFSDNKKSLAING